MIEEFSVKGFKVFRSLQITGLSRLNLFVGKNNVGKSCLLEAIRLWSANAHPSVLRDLVHSRDGDWEREISRRHIREEVGKEADPEDPIRFLFNDFVYKESPDASIELGPSVLAESIKVSLGRYLRVREDDGLVRRVRIDSQLALMDADTDAELMLEITIGSRRRALYPVEALWRRSTARPTPLDDMPV